METYSITSSSHRGDIYSTPRNLQYNTIPAEAEQIMNPHEEEEKFSAARNYLQNTSYVSSSDRLHDEVNSASDQNTSSLIKQLFGCSGTEIGGGKEASEEKNGDSGGKKMKGVEKKVRRPRFAFHTRTQIDILDDGYRWRKYGQKAVKHNNFPRSYYRCTHQGCYVKKQVQRLSKDEEVVVTTYEGTHTHPIERNSDNFEQILKQMQIYTTF